MKKTTFCLSFVLCNTFVHGIVVDILFSGRQLPNMDIFDGSPDPYLKVFYAEGSEDSYALVGETERLANTNNPDWGDVFNINYVGGTNQRLRFEVWDEDVDQFNDFMGTVDLSLTELVNGGQTQERNIVGCDIKVCGRLRITRRLDKEITPILDDRFLHPKNIINYVPASHVIRKD